MKRWRDRDVGDVTPSELRAWISEFNVTAKTAKNFIIPLRSILKDALNDDRIMFDPFDRIDLPKLLSQTARDSEYRIDPFSKEERLKLIGACRPDERPLVQFWFETGLRPSELHALRWSRIDLPGQRLKIDIVQVEKKEQARTKTEAGTRWVNLSEEAVAALEAQKSTTLLANEHVWHNPRKGQFWETADQMRKTLWVPLCPRAGIAYRNPYQVRHTYASSLLTAGENPWYVAEQLGHADVTMVFQTYGKFISKDYQKPTRQPNLKVV
jgi:integrase